MKDIKNESILLAEIEGNRYKVIFEKESFLTFCSASLSKVFLAVEFLRLLDEKKIVNRVITISKEDLEGYGTDVLYDLYKEGNLIKIDGLTLMGLMIKYSCNSSALILSRYFLPRRKVLQRNAHRIWGLKDVTLTSKRGEILTYFSLMDFLILFKYIFSKEGENWDFLREKLKTSRNIYYLFDQLEIDILGSKSGTQHLNGVYWISNCGLFRLKDKVYFAGASVSSDKISSAVNRIREIGKVLIAVAAGG